MSDNWVKPTVEQLRAELEWQRRRDRARRRAAFSIAVVAVAALISATWFLPRVDVRPGYALEEGILEEKDIWMGAEDQPVGDPA